ncbi:golgin-45-like [Daphnia carinata]|uniref:golgin-45-like n=1 Tax=Daphnia carinata TaxID=120202 RepID=UPI00257B9C8C|nr:golgin-45-like [Daphnia carinata]XP_057371219.1 golgin-45-like [Daphnia carinata]
MESNSINNKSNLIATPCPRTEGDGMEAMDNPITSDVKSAFPTMERLSLLPLKSLPPAERIISLVPIANLSGVKPKNSNSAMENKKAKFVPYEPYKAAVKPIVPHKKKISKKELTVSLENNIQRTRKQKDFDPHISGMVCQEYYDKIVKEKEELEAQVAIQSRVNAELKRLLVASVGEDMEARVHFLTEDKVKLADDIRQYVEKIALDFEQKEKLSIEADIWRSKFLASSVIIDELTKWKAALCTRNNNLQLCIQGLLDEMNSIQNHQNQTYNRLTALNNAFHPAGTSSHKPPELVAYDVIKGSATILKLVESLTKRLLGTYTQVRGDEEGARSITPSIAAKQSPAQLAAREVLTEDPIGTCKMSELANDLTAHHVAALARRSMNKSFYTCCAHCTGQVHVI